jgi:hypothetical protein
LELGTYVSGTKQLQAHARQAVEVYDAEKKIPFGKLRNSGWLDGTIAWVDSSTPFPPPT